MTTAAAKLRERETTEQFFPANEEAESMLVAYVKNLVRHKQETRSWGSSVIEVTWENGAAKVARIHEETTHKFGNK